MNLWTIYRLWREDSTWAHATGFLAGKYAPNSDGDKMGKGNPPHIDPDLEAHRLTAMALVATVSDILTDEGAPNELANAPFVAYFGSN